MTQMNSAIKDDAATLPRLCWDVGFATLARKFADPVVQADMKLWLFNMLSGSGRGNRGEKESGTGL